MGALGMSKKEKRQTRRTITGSAAGNPASGGRGYEVEFNPDYAYVIKDLKRIGALASVFFLVLIVLSFFLR